MKDERRFFDYLHDLIGLDIASVGQAMVERAVEQRRQASHALDLDAYWALLLQSAQEQQALIEAVIVPETWFMRYPESFTALANLAVQRLRELRGTRPLRLLSLPCSTGEEPYSIAMALFDAAVPGSAFVVDALDISPVSLNRAKQGIYGRNSFRGAHIEFRDRHFTAQADGYHLDPRVIQQVRFQQGNVLDPALLVNQPPYDFVFCRNLLIYFDTETQTRVAGLLIKLTSPEGVVFIGPAEGSLLARMGMKPLGVPQSFAFVRQVGTPQPAPAMPQLQNPVRLLPEPRPIAPPRFAPASTRVPARPPWPVPAAQDDAAQLLARIANLANEGRSLEARAACEQFLREHPPQAQVFYWLGLLSDVAGNALEAQGYYRKALYLEPQHPEALAHLAMLLAAQGDAAGARRLQERAARGRRTLDGREA